MPVGNSVHASATIKIVTLIATLNHVGAVITDQCVVFSAADEVLDVSEQTCDIGVTLASQSPISPLYFTPAFASSTLTPWLSPSPSTSSEISKRQGIAARPAVEHARHYHPVAGIGRCLPIGKISIIHHQGVVAGPALVAVHVGAAGEGVVAARAVQHVVAAAAVQAVVTGCAVQAVRVGVAGDGRAAITIAVTITVAVAIAITIAVTITVAIAVEDKVVLIQVGEKHVFEDQLAPAGQLNLDAVSLFGHSVFQVTEVVNAGDSAQVDPVFTGGEVIEYVDPVAGIELEYVLAQAALEVVTTGAALQHVVAVSAYKFIVACAAGQYVVILTAEQVVITVTAIQGVPPDAAFQLVSAGFAVQFVIAIAAVEFIVAIAAIQLVITVLAVQLVIMVPTPEHVVVVTAVQYVFTASAEQLVVAFLAVQLVSIGIFVAARSAEQAVVARAAAQGIVPDVAGQHVVFVRACEVDDIRHRYRHRVAFIGVGEGLRTFERIALGVAAPGYEVVETHRHAGGRILIRRGVPSGSADQYVGPGAAVQDIFTAAAVQGIVTAVPVERVAPPQSADGFCILGAFQGISSVGARDISAFARFGVRRRGVGRVRRRGVGRRGGVPVQGDRQAVSAGIVSKLGLPE